MPGQKSLLLVLTIILWNTCQYFIDVNKSCLWSHIHSKFYPYFPTLWLVSSTKPLLVTGSVRGSAEMTQPGKIGWAWEVWSDLVSWEGFEFTVGRANSQHQVENKDKASPWKTLATKQWECKLEYLKDEVDLKNKKVMLYHLGICNKFNTPLNKV